jgi:16S rRNA (cytosine967-C5)-methyltransferase
MRADARVQAAIDILEQVLNHGLAADRALKAWGQAHRFAGSGDRRAIADHVYVALRSAEGQGARAAMLAGLHAQGLDPATLFTGAQHAPAPLTPEEQTAAPATPEWLMDQFTRAWGDNVAAELAALNQRAPLDLRVNTLKTTRDAAIEALAAEGIIADPLEHPTALRVTAGSVDVESSAAYAQGLIEIQDTGSQIVSSLADARPGQTVLDLCCGAGGKTLALAAAMANTGRILAADTAAVRLKRLIPRAVRAGVTIATTQLLTEDWTANPSPFTGTFDRVIIDAPCSGSGTWRRNPETRARLTPDSIAALNRLQTDILTAAAPLVNPGGLLLYITCSVLPAECEDIAHAFLSAHPHFTAAPFTRLSPATTGTDGFFAAVLTRQ